MIKDTLSRANAHEHQVFHRYHWLGLRFLTYQVALSELMHQLAGKSQQRVQALIEVAASLPIERPPLRDPASGPEPASRIAQPFFILDDPVAAQELSRALLDEWRSRRFYEQLQDDNAIPALDAWLNDCIGQCRSQFQILQEARDRLPTLALPAPTSARGHGGTPRGRGREHHEGGRHSGRAHHR